MEKWQMSKRRRIQSLEPNTLLRTFFSQKYLSFLLPALAKFGSENAMEGNDNEIKTFVKFEVDMALVLSAQDCRWSRALKVELQRNMMMRSLSNASTQPPFSPYTLGGAFPLENKVNSMFPLLSIQMPLPVESREDSDAKRKVTCLKRRECSEEEEDDDDEEVGCRLEKLKMIMPGGCDMGVKELLSEIESYVLCLELQVNVLRLLTDANS